MPERAEIFVQHQQVLYFIQHTSVEDRRLRAIWVDPTTEEQRTSPATSPARAGLVYRLPAGSTIRRGAKKLKETTPVVSQGAGTKGKRPNVESGKSQGKTGYAVYPFWLCNNLAKDSYVLVASHFNPQSLILEFRNATLHALYLDIRLLLHVSVQIFTMSEWRDSICKVPRDRRGFKVAMALDLGPYIIAFLSHDLLFQVYWANDLQSLPTNTVVDVLHDWPAFLQAVACWVQQRRTRARSRDNPAFLAIHQADVFAGLGNYTLSEVFHRAGLRLSLSESELFDSPSRTARLCIAYREFAMHTESVLWPSMKRFFQGFKIAVERSHRLLYSKHLKVYGKEWTWVNARQGALLDAAIAAENNQRGTTYDIFEPSLVATSLTMEHGNLGHLIFGPQEWAILQHSWGLHVAEPQDALTTLYRPFLSYQRTYLRPGYYHDGLVAGQWNAHRFSTSMYRFALSPSALSSSPMIDDDEDDANHKPKKDTDLASSAVHRASAGVKVRMIRMPEVKRLLSTLATKIMTTRMYTVGPLDFCGIARVERAQGRGQSLRPLSSTFLCDHDPRVPLYYRIRRENAQKCLKTHFKAAVQVRHARKWNTRRKKGPSHKKDPNSTRTRRSPTTAEQLALKEGLAFIKELTPRRRL
ncbi:hypothetical protein NUW54_g4499 [Trametes sanguinea]|uniref:Uncharacterized protein n=1 Tax=Trametes sanguinea TaxID=158606 RepID=A0ACC1PZB2_9APHY|nr:hypothetical protein NUW54_g4499 [Trametes sanguinea]